MLKKMLEIWNKDYNKKKLIMNQWYVLLGRYMYTSTINKVF